MKLSSLVVTAGVAVLMCLNVAQTQAQGRQGGQGGGGQGQGRGNFDPEQMRQRMMEGYRQQLDVKDDAEWNIIEQRIQKVMEARRDVGFGGGMRMMGRRPPGNDNQQGDQANRRRFGPAPLPEQEALQKAVESNASTQEIKAAVAKYREARKQREAALQQAQQELKQVLNVKQEASAVLMGLVE